MKAVLFILAVIGASYVIGDSDQLHLIQDSLNKMVALIDQNHKTQVDLIKNLAYLKLSNQNMKWSRASFHVLDDSYLTAKWMDLKGELNATKNTVAQGLNDTQIDVIMDQVLTGSNSSIFNILSNANKVMVNLNRLIANLNMNNNRA